MVSSLEQHIVTEIARELSTDENTCHDNVPDIVEAAPVAWTSRSQIPPLGKKRLSPSLALPIKLQQIDVCLRSLKDIMLNRQRPHLNSRQQSSARSSTSLADGMRYWNCSPIQKACHSFDKAATLLSMSCLSNTRGSSLLIELRLVATRRAICKRQRTTPSVWSIRRLPLRWCRAERITSLRSAL